MQRGRGMHELTLDNSDAKRVKKTTDESLVSKSNLVTTDCDEDGSNKKRRLKAEEKIAGL